jgi:hypothetical protein
MSDIINNTSIDEKSAYGKPNNNHAMQPLPMAAVSTDKNSHTSNSEARLEIWLKKLPRNPLPINNVIARDVLQKLNDDGCDSPTLAQAIQKDPLLCLKLYHCTEQKMAGKEGDIQHLVHLIGLIGLDKIKQVITSSRKIAMPPDGFKEILSASLFSAHLSSTLLNKRHNATSDRFFLPTLFFNAPLWLMWIAAPKTMSQGQTLASKKQQSYIALSVKKLGFKLPDLIEKSDKLILLPKLTLDALAINPTKNVNFWAKAHHLSDEKISSWFAQDKTARNFFYSVQTGIYLTNQYVIAVYLDWNGKHIQRYGRLLCRHLGISGEELNNSVVNLAINTPLPSLFQGLLAPINRVRGLHRDPIFPASYKRPSQAIRPEMISAWQEKISQSNNVDTALEITLNALTHGVGVEHCVIMEVDEHDIHTQNFSGFSDSTDIKNFHSDWHTEKNLFQKMIQKPCCISVSSNDLPKATAKMPKQFTQYCEIKPCGLLSVFHQKKPKALIYCDHNQWDKDKHLHFKAVGKALALTLDRLQQ